MEYAVRMDSQPPSTRAPGSGAAEESCGVCGGDRRIGNSFGLTTTCPSCRGTGRRLAAAGFHDVTKTKPSHYRQPNQAPQTTKTQGPATHEGGQLAKEVEASTICTSAVKARLIQEIVEHEGSHGTCTQTFLKKIRKQIRPRTSPV
jgi:hypothetical protein